MSKNMRNKSLFFEYFVDALIRRNNNKTDTLTAPKIIRLLFLTVGLYSTDKNKLLTKVFNKFVAKPFGPVESDVCEFIASDILSKYTITNSECTIKNDSINIDLDDDSKRVVDDAVNLLLEKNPNILSYQPTKLVDIVQKWSCWKICYDVALANGNFNLIIPSRMIINSIKYYG
jgi:hypothetical protein